MMALIKKLLGVGQQPEPTSTALTTPIVETPNRHQYPTRYGLNVFVELVLDEATDTIHVDVIAPMYVNKRWRMKHSYRASHFTPGEILKDSDFNTVLTKAYQ